MGWITRRGNIIASGDIQLQAENLNNRHGQIGTAQQRQPDDERFAG
jgi:adhesin HecA-like repeat protein